MGNSNGILLGSENLKRKYILMLLSTKDHFYFPFVSTSLCNVKIMLISGKTKRDFIILDFILRILGV